MAVGWPWDGRLRRPIGSTGVAWLVGFWGLQVLERKPFREGSVVVRKPARRGRNVRWTRWSGQLFGLNRRSSTLPREI